MKLSSIIAIILLIPNLAFAEMTYQISRVKPHQRSGLFLLINNSKVHVELDCSSFLHNLTIKKEQFPDLIYYLTVEECEDFYRFYKKSSLQTKCLSHDEFQVYSHYCR